MSFDRLDLVIWSNIIRFCRRDPPPAYRKIDMDRFPQPDLATLSRVSSTFHELVIPFLYTSVVTSSLVHFLPKVPAERNDLKSLESKITSKIDRLARVKHLQIAFSRYEWMLEGSELHFASGIEPDIASSWLTTGGLHCLKATATICGHYIDSQTSILPNVETIIVGNKRGWNRMKDLLRSLPYGGDGYDTVKAARQTFSTFLVSLNPRAMCVHQPDDFGTPFDVPRPISSQKSTVIIHGHTHSVIDRNGPVVPYWINRHICPPGANWNIDPGYYMYTNWTESIRFSRPLWTTQRELRDGAGPDDKPIGTEFEFYGLHDSRDCKSYIVPETGKYIYQAEFEAEFERLVHPSWRGHVRFDSATKSPDCDVCGWTVAEGW